ncbi:hypothetical protein V2J09_014883 [Rumex salicifolius]
MHGLNSARTREHICISSNKYTLSKMFTSTDYLEDPVYFMDLSSPLNYFEFEGSILPWNNTTHSSLIGTSYEPIISTSSKLVLSNGDINGIVLEQDKGKNFSHGSNKKATTRRVQSKGDRHTKIPTANGLRDRRMRLSLDVARQFFMLQDMLSYDKPSKTVNWLLSQAKSAIEELNKGKKSSASSISQGEVMESAIDEHEISVVNVVPKVVSFKEKCGKKRKISEPRSVEKQVRKKLREEARERARERTQKKKYEFRGIIRKESEDSHIQDLKSASDDVFEIKQQIQDERNGFGAAITTNWSSLMSLNYDQEEDFCQMNPNQEFQQFHGTSREYPYSHPHLGQQYWHY